MTSWWTYRRPPDRASGLARLIPRVVADGPQPRFLPAVTPAATSAVTVCPGESVLEPEVVEVTQPTPEARNLGVQEPSVLKPGTVDLQGALDQESASRFVRPPGQVPLSSARLADPASPDASELPLSVRLAWLLQPPLESLLAAQGVLEWPCQLRPYQQDGVRALVERDALLLADDMGLGKTVQAIAALRILLHLKRIGSALVVVPAGLVGQWQRSFREWAPELRVSTVRGTPSERAWQWRAPVHVYLTSYETLRSDFGRGPQSPPRRRVWGVVVLDEAQKIKNRDVETSRVCKRLPRRRAWALTGTPLENSVDELASVCEFLTPWEEGAELPRLAPGPELLALHSTIQLRRKKRDVLPELPSKTVAEIALGLTPAQRDSYLRAEREGVLRLRELGRDVRIAHVLELIMRLKQICNFCPATGESAKLADLESRLEVLAEEGHRALVFSQFVQPYGVQEIARRLHRFQPLVYTGDQTAWERDRVIATFKWRTEHKALVLSLRAGGQGLNLQDASYVFHFDRWWNPAVERQAEDRTHRLGQTVPVTVYKYVCEGTIEERIDEILRQKQALFDGLVDDVSIDLRRHLTGEELFGLFGMEPPPEAVVSTTSVPADAFEIMSGEEFERYVGDLLRRLGWSVEATARSRDGGVDLKARKVDQVGVEMTLYVQCKNHRSPTGVDVIRELRGVLDPHVQGVVVCPSGFTQEAKDFAEDRGIALWDADYLRRLEQELGGARA